MNTVFFKGNQLGATPHISVIIDRVSPLHPNISIHILHTLLSAGWYRQGEFVEQSKLCRLGIIFFILMILMK